MITIDFETYYSKEFSLSKMSTEAYIRDPRFQVIGVCVKVDDGPIEWVSGTHEEIGKKLKSYHMGGQAVVAHNAAFDMAILNWVFDIRPRLIIDTLSMSRPFTGMTVGGSLKALAVHFKLGQKGTEIYNTIGKRLEDFSPEELKAFAKYCETDVELTYKLANLLLPRFNRDEIEIIDLTMRMFTEPVLELNKGMLEEHLKRVVAEKAELEKRLGEDRSVVMSNPKFAEKLRELGVEPPMKVSPTTGKATYAFAKTDEGLLSLQEHEDERVQVLVAARLGLKSTLEQTRTEAFLNIANRGLLPIMLNYYGAANTGRFSGGDNINPQNLPRGGVLRDSIQAPEGYSIVACDSSQIEARTLAWMAGQQDLTEAFANGEDIYCKFASTVYGRPITKEDKRERFVGKTCILGLGYQVGKNTLRRTLKNGGVDIPEEEAQRIVSLYRNTYSNISSFWKVCDGAIRNMVDGYSAVIKGGVDIPVDGLEKSLKLPSGFSLVYPALRAEQGEQFTEYTYQKRKFRNNIYGGAMTENIIQALARIVVSWQMVEVSRVLRKVSAKKQDGKIRRVVHMVHDEVIVVCPKEEEEATKRLMECLMKKPPHWAPGLPVNCEAGAGKTYADAK